MPDPNAAMTQTRPKARMTIVRIREEIRALLTRHAALRRALRPYPRCAGPPEQRVRCAGAGCDPALHLAEQRVGRIATAPMYLLRHVGHVAARQPGVRAVTMAALRAAMANPGSPQPGASGRHPKTGSPSSSLSRMTSNF